MRFQRLLQFIWEDFGPIVVFQIAYRIGGYRLGTEAAMIVAVSECWILWRKGQRPTMIFMMSTGLCLIFGTLDLCLNSTAFSIFEAPLINFFIAGVFAVSLRNEKSIVQELVEQRKDFSRFPAEDLRFFFGSFTLLWAAYYFVRAWAFLWVNLHTDISNGLLWRLGVGNISLLAMIGISTVGGRPLWLLAHKYRFLPSQRVLATS